MLLDPISLFHYYTIHYFTKRACFYKFLGVVIILHPVDAGHVSIWTQIFKSRRYLWEKMVLLTLPPSDWPLFTQAMPSFPAHHAELLLEMGLCYMAPGGGGGGCSRGWRPSRAGPISHGQLLRSRRVGEGKTWTWNDPSKQSPPWVHPQAKAPVPLTLKFSCSSLFLDLFFQLDQYIFQRGITPTPIQYPVLLQFSLPHTQSPPPPSTYLLHSSGS